LNVDNTSEGADVNALERPSVMESFRNRVDKFWNVYRNLETRREEVPDKLAPEYNAVMERGGRIRATIESVTNTYDAVADWVSDIFGFSGTDVGLDGVFWSDVPRGNLGAVQFVPLAVIAGSSALIAKWLKDAYTMERKLNEMNRLKEQGYNADRAAEIVNKTVSGPGLLNIGGFNMKPLLWIAAIGGGIWYANRKGWI
jgi:hypothetical protein